MIRIRIARRGTDIQEIKITGHALSAPYGEDLVCCGVSAISISALNAIDEMFPDACRLVCEDNRILIDVQTNSEKLQTALDMLALQLQCMAQTYPKHIQLGTD